MIRTITTQRVDGVIRDVQITCDECGAISPIIDIGAASTSGSSGLAALRERTGFIERPEPNRPLLGDTKIHDLCRACARKA